jgi:hypothetical protein
MSVDLQSYQSVHAAPDAEGKRYGGGRQIWERLADGGAEACLEVGPLVVVLGLEASGARPSGGDESRESGARPMFGIRG